MFCVINFTGFRSNAWTTSLYDLFRNNSSHFHFLCTVKDKNTMLDLKHGLKCGLKHGLKGVPQGNAISQPVFRYGFWGTVFCVINFTCFRSNAWTTSLYDLFRKD